MALSSIIGLQINSFFPEFGRKKAADHSSILKNAVLQPREVPDSLNAPINLMFSREGCLSTELNSSYKSNQFVPLFVMPGQSCSVNAVIPPKPTQKSILSFLRKPATDHQLARKESEPPTKLKETSSSTLIPDDSSASDLPETPDCLDMPNINLYDVGTFFDKGDSLTYDQKCTILQNDWRPEKTFIFPTRLIYGKQRKFNHSWSEKHTWLSYSKLLDGAFCLPCVLFGRRIGPNASKLDKLMKSPLTDWSCASTKSKEHSKSEIHKTALLTMQKFVAVKKNEIRPINQIQNKILDDTISKNRKKLASITKTVLLCGRQNIPLRGHRDDSKYYSSEDCGNFQALLNFRVESGDVILQDHFQNAPRNATYRSKTTQNELISCCAEEINGKIIKEIKDCGFYSILADEVTDCSNKEQMPLVLRYVDKEGNIH